MGRLSAGTEMVKDQDTPYLSIVGHVLVVATDDQEEYIGVVALLSMMGIECGNGVSDLVMIHVMERWLRSRG